MAFLETDEQRAAFLIFVLGIGLALTLMPFATGLIGGLVLYVVFAPVHSGLTRRRTPRALAALVVVILALVLIVTPVVTFAGVVATQAQDIASGVIRGPLLNRLSTLTIGPYALGPKLAGLGEQVVTWIGTSAFGLIGTATVMGLNLSIALFITYYLLLTGPEVWSAVRPYIPFSPASADLLRDRFRDVTTSTVIGTGLTALVQAVIVGFGFWATGLSNAVFWAVVTAVFAVLPIVGSGLIWGPGALSLFLTGRYGAAIALALIGVVLVGNVDLLIRPAVFRRYAQIHPLVTLIGAIGGVGYFGLLGILIGPLAISYFFELIRIYRVEYISPRVISP
jgi:predicted PurR-regulated permease PerM